MKQYSKWKNEEVITLFRFIEQGKQKGKSLSLLFENYAQQSGRKPNSVRNYYYAELSNLEQDTNRAKQLNIDITLHQKCEQKAFNEDETNHIVSEILRLKSLGYSVRKACLKLSDGNLSEMVRLQNKFRTVIKNNPNIVENCKQGLKQKGFIIEEKQECKILKMPQKTTRLSDSEINSLFLGLVKLVKKQAMEEANSNLKNDAEFANNTLRKTMVELQTKDLEIKKLRSQFKVVAQEKEKLKQEIMLLRGKSANLIKKQYKENEKLEKLKKFTKSYNKKQKQTAN